MRNTVNSLQENPIQEGVLVTEISRNETVNQLLQFHDLLQQLPLRWHNTQMTSKGVYIRLTLEPNNSYQFGSGKTFADAFEDLKKRLRKRNILS